MSIGDRSDQFASPALRTVHALLGTVSLYTFAGWAYIAGNAMAHPETLPLPLTHLAAWPREDTFAIVCFATSALTFGARSLIAAHGARKGGAP